jgi:hypothetical protein
MAQLAEQLTCNQQVVGSSPIASSICGGVPEWLKGADCKSVGFRLRWFESVLLHHSFLKCAGMAQLAEQLTCNQQVVGSSPIASSIYGGVPEWLKGADCKSVGFRLRWFESVLLHQKITLKY